MSTVGVEYVVETARMYAELQKIPGVTKQVLAKMAKEGAEVVAEQQRQIIRSATATAGGLRKTSEAATQLGVSSGTAKAGLFSLQQQLMDVGVMLQGGMSPATILATQGPQIATAVQQMGGAGAAMKAATAAAVPYLAVLGPIALAVAALGGSYLVLAHNLEAAEAAQRAESDAATDAQNRHEKLRDTLREVSNAYKLYTGETTETAIKQRDAVAKVNEAFGSELDAVRAKLNANAAEQERTRAAMKPLTAAEALNGGGEFEAEMTARLAKLKDEAGRLSVQLGALASRQAVAASQAYVGAQSLDKESKSAKATKEAIDELALSLEARVGLEAPFRDAMSALKSIRDEQRMAVLDPEAARRAQAMATSQQIADAQRASQALVLSDEQRAEVGTRTAEALTATWASYYADIDEMRRKDAEKEAEAAAKREKEAIATTQAILGQVGSTMSLVSASMAQASQNQVSYLGALQSDLEAHSADMTVAQRRHSRERIEQAREEATKGFYLAKAAAMAGAVVNTASAMVAALDDAPFPGNLVLSGLAGAAGAVQIGVIASQQPSFARGTTDAGDGFGATLHPREAVATSVGADMLGRDRIGKANAGVRSPEVIRVQMVHQHRSFDTFIGDNWDMFGTLRRRVQAGSLPGSRPWGE